MAAEKAGSDRTSGLAMLVETLKRFFTTQRDNFMARASSPPLTGINLIEDDYTPAKLAEHPGYGSHEEIEPMK